MSKKRIKEELQKLAGDNVREEWYKLDNVAKIYPSTENGRWNAVYRVCTVMKEKVDVYALQKALDIVIERYPALNVMLKKGAFWYYFQGADLKPVVSKEQNYPCQKFDIKSRNPLFRVLYSENRIIVEFSHCLTDGFGSINFLNTLVLKYLNILGHDVGIENVLHYNDTPIEEELEDSYMRYYEPGGKKQVKVEAKAYHLPGTTELNGVLNIVHGEVPSNELKQLAKDQGVTINQYVIGLVAYICYLEKQKDQHKNRKRPIKVQFTINLRSMLPSQTLRNFSAPTNVELKEKAEKMTFEEVLAIVKVESEKGLTLDNMRQFINSNCSIENNILMKIVPLCVKNLAMKAAYYTVGESLFTFAISNIGNVKAPSSFVDYVDRYEFILGSQKYNRNAVTVGSYNGRTTFTFSRRGKGASIERSFFKFLTSKGLNVTISSNKGGQNGKTL